MAIRRLFIRMSSLSCKRCLQNIISSYMLIYSMRLCCRLLRKTEAIAKMVGKNVHFIRKSPSMLTTVVCNTIQPLSEGTDFHCTVLFSKLKFFGFHFNSFWFQLRFHNEVIRWAYLLWFCICSVLRSRWAFWLHASFCQKKGGEKWNNSEMSRRIVINK